MIVTTKRLSRDCRLKVGDVFVYNEWTQKEREAYAFTVLEVRDDDTVLIKRTMNTHPSVYTQSTFWVNPDHEFGWYLVERKKVGFSAFINRIENKGVPA